MKKIMLFIVSISFMLINAYSQDYSKMSENEIETVLYNAINNAQIVYYNLYGGLLSEQDPFQTIDMDEYISVIEANTRSYYDILTENAVYKRKPKDNAQIFSWLITAIKEETIKNVWKDYCSHYGKTLSVDDVRYEEVLKYIIDKYIVQNKDTSAVMITSLQCWTDAIPQITTKSASELLHQVSDVTGNCSPQ